MKVLTNAEMRILEQCAIREGGIPSILLMEHAAEGLVDFLKGKFSDLYTKKVLFLCGKGNNGGDGFAAARRLKLDGGNPFVFALCPKLSGDAKINFEMLQAYDIPIIDDLDDFTAFEIIVDCIFGTGFIGELPNDIAKLITKLNIQGKYILSCDIPSGISGDFGAAGQIAVKANDTVTFGLPKRGLLMDHTCDYAGKLHVIDIGIPEKYLEQIDTHCIMMDGQNFFIPRRKRDVNKGSFGHVLIIAGSKGMSGAAILSANACMKSGAGKVTLAVPKSIQAGCALNAIECLSVGLSDTDGAISEEGFHEVSKLCETVDCVLVGPGLGTASHVENGFLDWIKTVKTPLIIDADGLNMLSRHINILKELGTPCIFTPHPGEMSRLVNKSIDEIQKTRLESAITFAKEANGICILKGARTITATPDGYAFINMSGNSGMASAGMGDLLAGIIASFVGQGMSLDEASKSAVYIHGVAGDLAAKQLGEYGITATDLLQQIPLAIEKYIQKI